MIVPENYITTAEPKQLSEPGSIDRFFDEASAVLKGPVRRFTRSYELSGPYEKDPFVTAGDGTPTLRRHPTLTPFTIEMSGTTDAITHETYGWVGNGAVLLEEPLAPKYGSRNGAVRQTLYVRAEEK